MTLYFADRFLNIIGKASTGIGNVKILKDKMVESLEYGSATFECNLYGEDIQVEPNGYVIRVDNDGYKLFGIVDIEETRPWGGVYLYSEDAGLDFLNSVVPAYEVGEAHPMRDYINHFKEDSGYEIGIDESVGLSRKLKWEGESTTLARFLSIATQFDCELSFSCQIDGMKVTHRYINIHRRRGTDTAMILRVGKEVKNIKVKRSAAELFTAVKCSGGTPEGQDTPITLNGYSYDDGDIYLDRTTLRSRSAKAKHAKVDGSDITGLFSFDTTSQSELCTRGVNYLKAHKDIAESYDVEFFYLPAGLNVGDTVTITDGELYLTARLQSIIKSGDKVTGEVSHADSISRSSASEEVKTSLFRSTVNEENVTYYITYTKGQTGKWAKTQPATIIDRSDGTRELYVNLVEDSVSLTSSYGWYRGVVRYDFEGLFSKIMDISPNWNSAGKIASVNRSGAWVNGHNFELHLYGMQAATETISVPVCIRGLR